jgi:hypothetical protein
MTTDYKHLTFISVAFYPHLPELQLLMVQTVV